MVSNPCQGSTAKIATWVLVKSKKFKKMVMHNSFGITKSICIYVLSDQNNIS